MTIKQAMAASTEDFGDFWCGCGGKPLAVFSLDHAWPLIPRDPADKNYQAFWGAMLHARFVCALALPTAPLSTNEVANMCLWLVQLKDQSKAARIICVAWLAAEGRVEA